MMEVEGRCRRCSFVVLRSDNFEYGFFGALRHETRNGCRAARERGLRMPGEVEEADDG